jgi:hypothetical protein
LVIGVGRAGEIIESAARDSGGALRERGDVSGKYVTDPKLTHLFGPWQQKAASGVGPISRGKAHLAHLQPVWFPSTSAARARCARALTKLGLN